MENLKKLIVCLLVLVMAVGLVGCGSKEKTGENASTNSETSTETSTETTKTDTSDKKDGFVIGFANGYFGNTWRSQLVEDFENAAKEYKKDGIIKDYMISNTNNDVTEQINQIITMIDAGVDALMIDAVSPTSIKAVVDMAKNKGILVVVTNDPAAYEGTYAVCGNNYSWQKIQAIWLTEQLQEKGNIVEISGVSGNAADILRQQANKDVLSNYPDIKILTSVPGNWSQTDAQSVMTTILSSYDNIDGVLAQDVMAEGIIKAYETAGKTPTIMTGDYTKTFFQKWSEMPDLNSIGVPYAPGVSATALHVTVKLLQGEKLKEDILQPNPMDENLKNTILTDPPYVVTKDGDPEAPWMEGLVGTKAITLDEAIEIMKDSPDTAALDGWLTAEDVSEFFE